MGFVLYMVLWFVFWVIVLGIEAGILNYCFNKKRNNPNLFCNSIIKSKYEDKEISIDAIDFKFINDAFCIKR